jgi:hypothetical protein
MGYKKLMVGADRFLALKWANYAFELFQTNQDEDYLYRSLRAYLDSEIEGDVTSRKTSNHLKRLWLTKDDPYQALRMAALALPHARNPEFLPILHLGLAMNVFPIYRETLRAIGTLERVINPVPKSAVAERVLENFGSTSSVPRAVARIIQTLEDWGFIEVEPKSLMLKRIELKEEKTAAWLITALVMANNGGGIVLSDLPMLPEKLGIQLPNPREVVRESENLVIKRNLQGLEVITTTY